MSTIEKERPVRGRPVLPKEEARKVFTAFKVTPGESEIIRKASEKAGVDKSEWMRRTLLRAAKRA